MKSKPQGLFFSNRNFFRSDRFGYVLLFLLSAAAFLPLITRIGFYWDDWPMLWFEVTQGPQGFADAFTSDRPFLGILYRWTGEIFSVNPLSWQLLTVVFRWLAGCAFFKTLRLLWKDRPDETLWIAAICAVYSGFKQTPIAYVWGNAFILLFFYLLSYVFMFLAIDAFQAKRTAIAIAHTVLGVVCYLLCTLCTEYYTGLDLARVVMIWVYLRRERTEPTSGLRLIRDSVLSWVPYLTAFIGFMVWRVFVFRFPSYRPVLLDRLTADPLRTGLGLLRTVLQDALTATWSAWFEFFRFPFSESTAAFSDRVFWIVVLLSFTFLTAALILRKNAAPKNNGASDRGWTGGAVVIGLSAIVLPGLPYVVTDLSPALTFPRDRWLTAYMFGSAILLVALIDWALRTKVQKILLVALTAAFMTGGNVLNTNSYARDWQLQKSLVEQLQARIPRLEERTYFFTDFNPLSYETDNSLTGMVNLALFPDHQTLDLPTAVGFFDVRFDRDLTQLESGAPIYHGFRSALFSGRASDLIVYFYAPPGCLRVLDPAQHADLPIFPSSFYDLIPLSNLDRIRRSDQARTPFLRERVFRDSGGETWCAAFQKADLARQFEDWEEIAKIGDESIRLGAKDLSPAEASELIPFIEAYAHTAQWQKNIPLIRETHRMNPDLDRPLCARIQRLLSEFPIDKIETFNEVQAAFYDVGCSLYASENDK